MLSLLGFSIGGDITWQKFVIVPITTGHQFELNLGGWFVIPLFMLEVFNVVIRRIIIIKNKEVREIFWFAVYFVLGIISVLMANKGFNSGWWLVLDRVFLFLPFFGAGLLYKNVLEKHDKLPNAIHFVIIFIAQLVFIYFYKSPIITVYSWCIMVTNNPLVPYIEGFLGIAFWFRVSICMEPILGKNTMINTVADNAVHIMIHQLMGFMIVKTFFALLYKYNIGCLDFDFESYLSDIYYYYVPKGIAQFKIIYLTAGVSFPIIVGKMQNNLNKLVEKRNVFEK